MTAIPLADGLLLAATLFVIGMAALMARRSAPFLVIAAVVMLNASGLAFVVAGARWGQADGQVMALFVLLAAAAAALAGSALARRRDSAEERPPAPPPARGRWRFLRDTGAGQVWQYATALAAGAVFFVVLVLWW
ncbi:MAG: NADH-quinone oxidoreductase subunit K [Acidobacteriota bacterium]|nr:NADH-quinone oxidoreductase subunit K [Acidobacteriota bacterium]